MTDTVQQPATPAPTAPVVEQGMTDDAALAYLGLGPVTEQPKPEAQASAEVVPSETGGEVNLDLTPLNLQGVPQSVLDLVPKPLLQEWSNQAKDREAKRSTDF